ncbi:MAG: 8-oxo-dGTP diphosphatase [bacterium]
MVSALNEIDWSTWEPGIRATLLFVVRDDQVLLIRKKRGLGAGKVNGPGGKLDPGESPRACAIRETREEVGVLARGVQEAGVLRFEFVDGLRLLCTVFRADDADGDPHETAEAAPFWAPIDALPFDEMWADDRLWLPALLARQPIKLWALFEGDRMLDSRVEVGSVAEDSGITQTHHHE